MKFACSGDIGNGSVTLRSHTNVEKPDLNVDIELTEPVALTFSLKYLVNFCKASGLSSTVKLCLSNEVPLLVEYGLASNSYLRFYLAPKVQSAISLIMIARIKSLILLHRLEMKSSHLMPETLKHETCISKRHLIDVGIIYQLESESKFKTVPSTFRIDYDVSHESLLRTMSYRLNR